MIDLTHRHPPKPISRPDHIAVMVPSRGRPAMLSETIASFLIHSKRPDEVSLWVGVDDDDRATLDYAQGVDRAALPIALRWVVRPRQAALAMTWNLLWQAVEGGPGSYLGFVDDYAMTTPGWDEALRATLGQAPAGLGLGQIPDPMQPNPDTMTIIAGTAGWFNRLGYFVPPYFPFWFADTWHDHLALAADLKFRLAIAVAPQRDGMPGTQRMRDLGFWYRVFCRLIDERLTAARALVLAAHGVVPDGFGARETLIRAKTEALEAWVIENPEAVGEMERRYASRAPWSEFDEARYAAMKSAVEAYLGPRFAG